jgi:tetratricopeptide (TPR) repeat protein
MEKHFELTESELAALARGELPPGSRGLEIAIHLRGDCATCKERWGDRLAPLLDPAWAGDDPPRRDFAIESRFDFSFRQAVQQLKKRLPAIQTALNQARQEIAGTASLHEGKLPRSTTILQWARAQEWLEKARLCRRHSPEEYAVLSALAAAYALRLRPEDHPRGEVADLQALALAEAANSHRRARRFAEAEVMLSEASAKVREGTLAHPVALEVVRLSASFLIDQRDFDQAVILLRRTFAGYEALGLRHEAGEQAIALGFLYQYKGDHLLSVETYRLALERIDGARDPELSVAVVHNILRAYLELEQWPAAQRLLPRAAALHQKFGTPLDGLKFDALRARLLAGRGSVLEAGRAYEDVIAEFERQGQYAESAVVRLELAGLYLSRRRFDRAQVVLEDVREVFESIGIHREAFAALVLLKQAVAGECATLEMVQKVVAAMEVGAKGR